MRVHECWQVGCHVLCEPGHDWCDKHELEHKAKQLERLTKYHATDQYREYHKQWQRQYNRDERDQQANAFYQSSEWNKLRDYVKRRDVMIDGSTGQVLSDHDYIVDHIVPRRYCDNPLDASNLWLLSRRQHNRKTIIEQAIENKQNGKNMLKHISKQTWKRWLNEKSPRPGEPETSASHRTNGH